MTRRKYSAYKSTEIEWLGNIPSHWQQKWLGILAKMLDSAFVDGPFGSDLKSSDYQDDGVPLIQLNNIRDEMHVLRNMKFISVEKETELIRHRAVPGDIVIAKMAEPVARAAIVSDHYPAYIIVADCVKMTPDPNLVDSDFLVWVMNSDCVRISAELAASGVTRIRINLGLIKKLKIPYPPVNEQTQIARFLDHETAKIDALIAEQKRLINLLQEKRQAVISHAVTKGLDPNAPMKDSGVEWLGEVPAHWKQSKLKHFSTINGRIGFRGYTTHDLVDEGDGAITLSPSNMVQGRMDYTKTTYISWDKYYESPEIQLQEGDIVLVKTGSTYGRVALVDRLIEKTTINPQLAILRPKNVEAKYFLLFLNSEYFKAITRNSNTGGTMPTMTQESVMNIIATLPSLQEQKEIVSAVGELLQDSEVLESEALKGIDLLKERRAALISAAVTGKIDVRDWQPPADESAFDEDVRKAGLEASA